MKTSQTSKFWPRFVALVGGFAWFTGTLQAEPFLYTQGDLTLAFRQTGNSYDYVVNIGKATNFNHVPVGQTIVIANFSVAQFTAAFAGGFNDVNWSVAGNNRYPALNTNLPENTLWVTRARDPLAPGTQSAPWVRFGYFSQASSGGQIDIVGQNARDYSSSVSSNANNGVFGVVLPVSSSYAYTPIITTGGNYGNFQGNIENTIASDFDTDPANVSRSDLYELLPGSGYPNGRYLGYFELKPDGTLTFNTLVTAPSQPVITSITRSGTLSTVSFTTATGVTYRLRYTDAAGLQSPISTWSIGGSISGTGAVLSLPDTRSTDVTFYAIEALP